jgi:type IV secretion system protein VirD4
MQDHASLQDPFWDERATAMIVAVICELFRALPSRQPTLRDVQAAIRGAPIHDIPTREQVFEALAKPAGGSTGKGISLNHVITSAEFSTERTRASIMATAMAHMGFLRSPAVHASLTNSTITLDDITAGAMQTIYLILPPDKLITHGKLLRLWIGVMLAAIARRRFAPPQPTLFLIDEAAQLGSMAELKSALTLMRAFGVRVWTFWQDLTQLQDIYPKDWKSIINNSKVQQYFGAKSPPAKAALKKYLGDAWPSSGVPDDSQILFDGSQLKVVRRPDYIVDPIFGGLASPHPFHVTHGHLQL